MGQLLLYIVVALVVAAIVFGITVMVSGGDSGLTPVEPDGRALSLPSDRPLAEDDLVRTRFDTAWRGYRMAQVDQALRRAAYDIGYKSELITVLEAEVAAVREGRMADADVLRQARLTAVAPQPTAAPAASGDAAAEPGPAGPVEPARTEVSTELTGPPELSGPAEPAGAAKPSASAEPSPSVGSAEPAEVADAGGAEPAEPHPAAVADDEPVAVEDPTPVERR